MKTQKKSLQVASVLLLSVSGFFSQYNCLAQNKKDDINPLVTASASINTRDLKSPTSNGSLVPQIITTPIQTSGCGGLTTLTDNRDKNVYKIVQTGTGTSTQCWMAQNLNYSTSGVGTPVVTGQGGEGIQKYCYGDILDNCNIYGGLYEWDEMLNGSVSCNGDAQNPACKTPAKGICREGWHIPSHYEWTLLEKSVGTDPDAFLYDILKIGYTGTDEGGNLKNTGTAIWMTPNTGATNASGFLALPGGYVGGGTYSNLGLNGYWWTASESLGSPWYRNLNYSSSLVNRRPGNKARGFSVRCVKD